MIDLSAERRLVKSPPELWAEISDPEAMAKHLGEFGEIRITRVEPEHTVAWEGELAKGTARIESSGWGTKVVLTAEIPEPGPEIPEPAPEPEPAPPPEPEPAPPPQPGPVEPEAALVEPDGADPEPDSVEPEPPEPQHDDERMSLLARLFGVRWTKRPELQHLVPEAERKAEEQSEQVQIEAEPQREPESGSQSEPQAEPQPQPQPQPQAEPQPEPQPQPQPEYTVHPPRDPEPEPEEVPIPEVPALDPERARAVLDGTLEALGAAHHRPFSRV